MKYILREAAASSGHVYLPEEELCSLSASLLQVPPELCDQALRGLLLSGGLRAEADDPRTRRVYLPFYHIAEQEVALMIRRLMNSLPPDPYPGVDRAISA